MLKRIVTEIYGSGLSEAEIARTCATSQPTVHRIRTGKTLDTRSQLADRLRSLHAKLVDEGRIHPAPEDQTA